MQDAHIDFMASNNTVGIKVENLKIFSQKKVILTVEKLFFPKKGIVSVMGPSGCGKSSLLKVMSNLADECIRSEGNIALSFPSAHANKEQQQNLAYIFSMVWQQPTVFPTSIWNNLKLPLKIKGVPKPQWRQQMEKTLAATGLLEELGNDWPQLSAECISGGQQQRLSIAMGLLKDSPVILLDEPTSALDPVSTDKIEKIITAVGREKLVILVTHSIGQAKRISEYTAMFCNEDHHGYLCEFGLTEQIFNDPKASASRQFILQETGL